MVKENIEKTLEEIVKKDRFLGKYSNNMNK